MKLFKSKTTIALGVSLALNISLIVIFSFLSDNIQQLPIAKYHAWTTHGIGHILTTLPSGVITFCAFVGLLVAEGSLIKRIAGKYRDDSKHLDACYSTHVSVGLILTTTVLILVHITPLYNAPRHYENYNYASTDSTVADVLGDSKHNTPRKKLIITKTIKSTKFTQIDGQTFKANDKTYKIKNKQNIQHEYGSDVTQDQIVIKQTLPKPGLPNYLKENLKYNNRLNSKRQLSNYTTVTIKLARKDISHEN